MKAGFSQIQSGLLAETYLEAHVSYSTNNIFLFTDVGGVQYNLSVILIKPIDFIVKPCLGQKLLASQAPPRVCFYCRIDRFYIGKTIFCVRFRNFFGSDP